MSISIGPRSPVRIIRGNSSGGRSAPIRVGPPGRVGVRRRRARTVAAGAELAALHAAITAVNKGEYWRMNEASGNRAGSINAQTLTNNNTVGSATGIIDALSADLEQGSFESLSRDSEALLQTGDISVSFQVWVKPESFDGDASFNVIWSKWRLGEPGDEYLLSCDGSGLLSFRYRTGVVQWGTPLSTGQFYCLHARHDPVANILGLAANAGTEVTESYSGGATAGPAVVRFGGFNGDTNHWDGMLGQAFFVKDYQFSGADRTALYNGGAGRGFSTWNQSTGARAPIVVGA